MRVTHRAATLVVVAAALAAVLALAVPASAAPTWGSGVSAARNAYGQLQLFASDFNGRMKHNEQRAGGGGWTGWSEFGGSGFALARPAVARNADGRLEVFAQRGGDLYHRWEQSPGGSWSGWENLGGDFASGAFSNFAVAANSAGLLELFGVDKDGDLAHNYQRASGGWAGWRDRGGDFPVGAVPAVASNDDGRLEVFLIARDGTLMHIWQTAPTSGWSGWGSLGGTGQLNRGDFWGPGVGVNADGRLEVFARFAADQRIYHRWQKTRGGSTGWSAWTAMNGRAGMPVVGTNDDGRLELFGTEAGGLQTGPAPYPVRHIWQRSSGGWSNESGSTTWSLLSEAGPPVSSGSVGTRQAPTVASNSDGRLEVFAQGFDGAHIYHVWQLASGGWSKWERMAN